MAYNFSAFKSEVDRTTEWLKKEYTGIRTGRATPSILDAISVDAYGSKMQVRELANISVEDPRTIRVVPWDATVTKSIDSAVRESNLGLSVAIDDKGLRISFPELTAERRTSLVKVAKQKLEEARIALRGERQKVLNDLDKQEKDGKISEDDKVRAKNDLQKLMDEANSHLEEITEKKEKEILE